MHRRFLLLVFAWAMSCTLALADTLSIPNTFTAGTTIQSSQMNANFASISTWAAGSIANDNIKSAAAIAPSKLGSTSAYPLLLLASGTTGFSIGNTGDTQPRFAFDSDGKLKFGPGGSTAIDTILKRSAVGKLAVRNAADAANADLDVDDLGAATVAASGAITGASIGLTNGSTATITPAAMGANRAITLVDPGATSSLRTTTGSFNAGAHLYTDGTNILSGAAGTAEQVTFSGGTGAPVFRTMNFSPGGRLTLTSGTPVTVSDVSAAGTIYYTPYMHKSVWLKTGSSWVLHQVAETSLALSISSGSVYDVFMYSNAGTPTLETLVWTNTTTRATAVVQDSDTGLWIKSGDATRLYLGTIYGSGANQATDSMALRGVWNCYNRVWRGAYATQGSTWTYNSATWRAANSNTTNGQGRISAVIGLAEDFQSARVNLGFTPGSNGIGSSPGVGIDSTSVNSAQSYAGAGTTATLPSVGVAEWTGSLGIGFRFIQWLEQTGTNTATMYGSTTVVNQAIASALHVVLRN